MFTVYGLNGRIFSGPLEGLRELGPVQAVARLRAVERVGLPTEPAPGVLLAGPAPDDALAHLGMAEPRQRDALAAYAQAGAAGAGSGASARQAMNDVHALMSQPVITVPLSATVAEGQVLLAHAGIGQAPVVDGNGRLVGLLLRADLLPAPQALGDADSWRAWLAQPVSAVMWTPVPSVHRDTSVRAAAQVMLELRLPGLPVLDEAGELMGFLSRSDLLRALSREPPLDVWT